MKLTKSEALTQGYEMYGTDMGEFQRLSRIEHLNEDNFEDGPIYAANKEPYYTPQVSKEFIATLLAEQIADLNHDQTGDDDDDVFDIVKVLNFTAAADMINEALKHKKYYKLTKIEIVPDE